MPLVLICPVRNDSPIHIREQSGSSTPPKRVVDTARFVIVPPTVRARSELAERRFRGVLRTGADAASLRDSNFHLPSCRARLCNWTGVLIRCITVANVVIHYDQLHIQMLLCAGATRASRSCVSSSQREGMHNGQPFQSKQIERDGWDHGGNKSVYCV